MLRYIYKSIYTQVLPFFPLPGITRKMSNNWLAIRPNKKILVI